MKQAFILWLTLWSCVAGAENAVTRFSSDELGFSLQAPVTTVDSELYQVAIFFLPPENGFAANVNVQRQRFPGSIAAYGEVSRKQLRELGWALVKESMQGNELHMEYTGDFQQRKLRWYSRAVLVPPYVYLITATALDSSWNTQKGSLVPSVESFRKW